MTKKQIRLIDVLFGIAYFGILYGSVLLLHEHAEPSKDLSAKPKVLGLTYPTPSPKPLNLLPFISKDSSCELSERDRTEDYLKDIETSLFYAAEPIGRYYITAYSHLETGSKMTASGATCHEGTITTCAADPKYHKFGEYLEIGGRIYRVEDTGALVKKRHIDVYIGGSDIKKVKYYDSHYETIYKVTFPFGTPKDN